MKKIILTTMAIAVAAVIFAQNPDVKVYKTINSENSFSITMKPVGVGYFTVWLDTTETVNTEAPKSITRIINDKSELIFKPIDKSKPAIVYYTYSWLHGKVNATPTEGFVYSLPVRSESGFTVQTLTPLMFGVMNQNISKLYAFRLYTNDPERIRPMREGLVTEVSGTDMREPTTIIVEHADGTQAEYRNILLRSVAVGDMVTTQTTLGASGTLNDGQNGIDVAVYRYIDNNNKVAYPQAKTRVDYINPLFATTNGNVTLEDGKTYTADTQTALKKDIHRRCSCGRE